MTNVCFQTNTQAGNIYGDSGEHVDFVLKNEEFIYSCDRDAEFLLKGLNQLDRYITTQFLCFYPLIPGIYHPVLCRLVGRDITVFSTTIEDNHLDHLVI